MSFLGINKQLYHHTVYEWAHGNIYTPVWTKEANLVASKLHTPAKWVGQTLDLDTRYLVAEPMLAHSWQQRKVLLHHYSRFQADPLRNWERVSLLCSHREPAIFSEHWQLSQWRRPGLLICQRNMEGLHCKHQILVEVREEQESSFCFFTRKHKERLLHFDFQI